MVISGRLAHEDSQEAAQFIKVAANLNCYCG